MDDGMIQLRVEELTPDEVRCVVVAGGRISDHKGISLPNVDLPASCLTEKDVADLRFGIEQRVDFVAVSFVRSAADIREVRRFLETQGADIPVVAKLERHEVLGNLGDVVGAVDAVMVARGDLGVDVPLEDVPHIQKEIIREAHRHKVPVIVATQMLESMVTHTRPTRAEVADVTAAIFDGADAIMLSAETASGRYPAEAVETMARIAERAEQATLALEPPRRRREGRAPVGFPEAISDAAASAARALDARAIVAFTQSGFSARLISQERPAAPIIAFTPFAAVQRRLALTWGVTSRLIRKVETTDDMVEEIEATLLGDGTVRAGDVLVIISGSPMWVTGTTNLLKLHRVGERR
jgi:pyruvate kinase